MTVEEPLKDDLLSISSSSSNSIISCASGSCANGSIESCAGGSCESSTSNESSSSIESCACDSIVSCSSDSREMSLVSVSLSESNQHSDIVKDDSKFCEIIESDNDSFSAIVNSGFNDPTPSDCTPNYYIEDSSWSESIEAFINQLNDVGVNYNTDQEDDSQLLKSVTSDSDFEDIDTVVGTLKRGQNFLMYLTVPVLLSQLLMLIILSNSSSSENASVPTNLILSPIQAIHHHQHHHYYNYKICQDQQKDEQQPNSPFKRFFYIFFNPFSVIYKSKYFKQSSQWITQRYSKQLEDPNSLLNYFSGYFDHLKGRVLKLDGIVRQGLGNELGKALRVRDNWNRAIYEKIYEIAATPQYQRTIGTISKWASALKNRIFS